MRAVDHYVAAEQLLALAEATDTADPLVDVEVAQHRVACAQVHASLALAGATAMQSYGTAQDAELDDWQAAAGGPADDEDEPR